VVGELVGKHPKKCSFWGIAEYRPARESRCTARLEAPSRAFLLKRRVNNEEGIKAGRI
jgi:hypothetical protein